MEHVNTLSHTQWDGKYHVVFIPQYRWQALYKKVRSVQERGRGDSSTITLSRPIGGRAMVRPCGPVWAGCRLRGTCMPRRLRHRPYATQRNITWAGLWVATCTVLVSVC